MFFLNLYQFLTLLLTSEHLKLFSTYLVVENGTMWKTCFSDAQNAKKKNQQKHKSKCVTDFSLNVRFPVWWIILVITGLAHERQTFTPISKKKWEIKIFCLHVNDYLNTKKSIPICIFVVMDFGKCELHIYFTFLQNSNFHILEIM